MRTLVALLGTSPGTVTTAYYALCEKGYGPPDRIVVVATEARETEECLKMVRGEFHRLGSAEPQLAEIRVPISDLEDEDSTKKFQAQMTEVLRCERDRIGNEVWLCIAGGRKSMAALAAIAAQFVGVDMMFHLYVVPQLEQHGDVNQLLLEPEWQPRCLHPQEAEYALVAVPFFQLNVEHGDLRLLLEGEPDDFVHQIVQAKPGILAKLPESVVHAYWGYIMQEYGQPPEYDELTVRIGPRSSSEVDFPVTTSGEGPGDISSVFISLFTPAEVRAAVNMMRKKWLSAEQQRTALDLGRRLFDSLFTGNLVRAYYRQQGWVASERHRLRLRLRLAPDARLDGLLLRQVPWELLHDEQGFLGLRREISVVRHLETEKPIERLCVEGPLRVLVVAASPSDQDRLPEDFELEALYTGVQPLALRLAVEGLQTARPRTFEALRRRLAEVRPDVLYFTGHGLPGGLVFERDDGTSDVRSAEEMGALLAGQGVRLAVVNACYGAQAPGPDLPSIAEALIEAGLPAVVGMQSAILAGEVWYAPAARFAQELFFSLALGWPVDACVTEARRKIQEVLPESFQWALPVCFMRTGDGRLFSFEDA
jgi:CRISPR-associated Csx14 family protein